MRELQLSEIENVSGGHWNEDTPTGYTLRLDGRDYWVDTSEAPNPWGFDGGSGSGGDGTVTTSAEGPTVVTWNLVTSEITIEATEAGFFDLNGNGVNDEGLGTDDGVTSVVIDYEVPINAVPGLLDAQFVNASFTPYPSGA